MSKVRGMNKMKNKRFSGWFGLGLVSLLLLAGSGCETATQTTTVPPPHEQLPSLTVMTFNIRYGTARDGENHWDKRKEQVAEVIRKYRPDVVGLQEALRFQIDYLREQLPEYDEIGVGRDDGRKKGEYSCLLYRKERLDVTATDTFWYSNTPKVPGSHHWGNTIPRICTWGRFRDKQSGVMFYVYNTHWDHRSQPSREYAAVMLSEVIRDRQGTYPFIITGDFNAGESNPAIRYLKGEIPLASAQGVQTTNPVPLRDSFRVVRPAEKIVGTFNQFKGERTGEKIDYIFISPGISVEDAQIVTMNRDGRYPSDHFPVWARLVLPGK